MRKEDFDEVVAEYYDEVIEKGYHDNKKYLSDLLNIIKESNTVLELGCGTGKIFLELLKNGVFIEGLDISQSMIKKLKSKNSKAIVHESKLINFTSTKKYDYIFSCNGPFSLKGDELESYILEEDQLMNILEKYVKMSKNGLLINKGTDKPILKIPLNNGEMFIHKEIRENNFMILFNILLENEQFKGIKTFVKRRYKISEVLKNYKIKDLGSYKLISF